MSVRDVTSEARSEGQDGLASVGADVAAAIDRAVDGPVLVVGSPPPGGRDLDLLAKPEDYTAIANWLAHAGFVSRGHTWAILNGGGVYAVELSTTDRWRTKRDDASSLFSDTEPIPGFRHLVSPSPATVLLLAARGTVTRRGHITDKVRRRVSQALERDPDAWTVAEERGRALGMVGPLHLLREAYGTSGPLSPAARVAGLSGVLLRDGPLGTKARILLGARPRRLRPAIISFSGLDGSGKSTQVSKLQDRLGQVGVASERQWAGFKTASRVRAAFPILNRPTGAGQQRPHDRLVPTALLNSPVGIQAWVFVVVGVNAIHLWRLVLRRPGAKIVIFDRFSPDTMVKLDLHYHRSRNIDIRWQRMLFTLISPKPDVGFLIDVSSEVAYSRRQEQTPEELATMAELYQEQVPRFGLHRLDGTQSADALGEQVAVAVWRGLR